MQGVQKRPLSGMVVAGVAAPRAIDNVAPTTVHTLDNVASGSGGPYVDMVTLWVNNPTGGAVNVSVIAAGGATILVAIPTLSTVKILDEEVFHNVKDTTAKVITAQGSAAGLVFWGDFARVL